MIGAHERSGEAEIATSTLAEIYVQQGLVDRALVIYRRLAQRSPGDARIATRVAELETELERHREPADLEGPAPAAFESALTEEAAGSELASAPPVESELAPTPPVESELAPAPEAGSRPSAPPVAADRQFLAWLEKR
ncbi:MAG: tetratricopeptide repeat protein [Gemmatimonadota bacterium]